MVVIKEQINRLQQLIDASNSIVAITGAGLSVLAGINDMEHLNFASTFQMMSETILKTSQKHYYKFVRKGFLDATFIDGPTISHKKLAELEQMGKLRGIITTNIDCMHTVAGNQNVAEIQGSFRINECLKCGKEYIDVSLWNKGNVPKCTQCGGLLSPIPVRSHVGIYQPAARQARQWLMVAVLVIVIGSKGMYGSVYFNHLNRNTKLLQINPKQTVFDGMATLNIKTAADKVMTQILVT